MERVMSVAENVVAHRRPGTTEMAVFTATESRVLSRSTYYGSSYGVAAGVAVFGAVFGGLRYAAYRRFLRAQSQPNSAAYHARTSASRQQYAALDAGGSSSSSSGSRHRPAAHQPTAAAAAALPLPRGGARAPVAGAAPASSSPPPPPAMRREAPETFTFYADEIMVQAQCYITVALSLVVGIFTAHLTWDEARFRRDLAAVPLQPGPSALCHELCPQLVQYRRELHTMPAMPPFPINRNRSRERDSVRAGKQPPKPDKSSLPLSSTMPEQQQQTQQWDETAAPDTSTDSDLVRAIRQFEPGELLRDPVTEGLESARELLQNCQHRMDFEDECRRRNHRVDGATGLVDVPEPGVPVRYLRSDGGSSSSRRSPDDEWP